MELACWCCCMLLKWWFSVPLRRLELACRVLIQGAGESGVCALEVACRCRCKVPLLQAAAAGCWC